MGLFLFWIIMAVITAMIAKSRGRDVLPWLLYGFVIWPIAVVHALLLKQEPEPQPTGPSTNWQGRPPEPGSANSIGDGPAIPMPSRYEMMMRHGERPGAAAWDLMRAAAKAGRTLPEDEALAEVRRTHG